MYTSLSFNRSQTLVIFISIAIPLYVQNHKLNYTIFSVLYSTHENLHVRNCILAFRGGWTSALDYHVHRFCSWDGRENDELIDPNSHLIGATGTPPVVWLRLEPIWFGIGRKIWVQNYHSDCCFKKNSTTSGHKLAQRTTIIYATDWRLC